MADLRNLAVFRAMSDLMARAGLGAAAGYTFGGDRHVDSALGYQEKLEVKDYRRRYKRGGIAARIVDSMPNATWRGGAELIEDENPESLTAFEQAWTELAERLQVWSIFNRADILAGLGRYSVILIGAPGELSTPLPKRISADAIVYLQPFAEDDARVDKFDEDPSSPRFGKPLNYRLLRAGSRNRDVHFSRVLHFADGALDDQIYGEPRLERVWNNLDDLIKVVGAGAEAYWRRADPGMLFEADKDLELKPDEALAVEEAADEMVHKLRRVMAVRGMKGTLLGSSVSDFSGSGDFIITLISGASGIPKRILVGSERGELASTQDRENWNDRVNDRRTNVAEPLMVRPFVKILTDLGALPTPKQYIVRWPLMEAMTPKEQAELANELAGLNVKAGGIVIKPSEIRDRVLRLPAIKDEVEDGEVGASFTAAQIDAVMNIVAMVEDGTLGREVALAMLQIMLGIPGEAAEKLIPEEPEEEEVVAPPTGPVPIPPPPPSDEQPPADDESSPQTPPVAAARRKREVRYKKMWVAHGSNPCPVCEEMDGTEIDVDEFFELPDGTMVLEEYEETGPGHPNCDCRVRLVRESQLRAFRHLKAMNSRRVA